MEAFLAVVFILVVVFGLALAYKKRVAVANWLNAPGMAMENDPKRRKTILQRRIEDSQEEIERIDALEDKPDK